MSKIPIKIHPFFWVFAFLIGWLNSGEFTSALIWMVIILISVLVHEFGHAIAAIAFGQRVKVHLVAFGGLTFRHGPKLSPLKDFIVVLCGPLAGFSLYLVGEALLPLVGAEAPLLLYGLKVTVMVNLIWTLLNLLPVQPLDGGKLFSIILEAIFGLKGYKAALIISVVLGFGLSLVSFLYNQLFLGILFFLLAYESLRSKNAVKEMSVQDKDETLQLQLKNAGQLISEGKPEEALSLYQDIRNQTHAGMIYLAATEAAARLLVEKGQTDENSLHKAYELLLSIASKSPRSLALLHRLAFQLKDYDQVVKIGNETYQHFPSSEISLLNAIASAALGKVEAAVGWLECTAREGMTDIQQLLQKKEFDRVRNEPLFEKFVKSMTGR